MSSLSPKTGSSPADGAALALAMLLVLAGICSWAATALAAGPQLANLVISSSRADLDGDGRTETVEVVMTQGRRWMDDEPWCGAGDKWQGKFLLRVKRQGRVLSRRSWAELLPAQAAAEEDAFFWAPKFKLVFRDYNGDGRLDFNLGQYGSCNGNLYVLLSLDQNDRLVALPIQDRNVLFVSPASRNNSTTAIKARNGAVTFQHYDNVQGRMLTQQLQWREGMFVPLPE